MDALLSAAQWVVGKALAPVSDGVLEAWGATKNLGINIEALRMELLLVKATLETASHKQVDGPAMQELLGNLRDSALSAEDLLDELDYFRIHDQLHGTYEAADQHAKGRVHDLALNARHAAKAVGKLTFVSSCYWSAANPTGDSGEDAGQRASCCAWPRARQRPRGNSSSTPNANQEVSVCSPKLDKLLPCSSSPHAHDDHFVQPTLSGAPQRETPMPGFNRVDFSERMRHIVEQLQHVRKEVTQILQSCHRITIPDISESRPITIGQSIEPKLYGRDDTMDTIIHDMTKGIYLNSDLTVLPIVGPGGIGKTTLIQHIYRNQQVQNHFQVVIWVCVSLNFNLNKLLEEIKTYIPRVEGEKDGRVEELIEQRLKSKRFLLVLDDIWNFSDEDDWKRLLLPLKTSQEKGSMILVTTRFPAIAKIIGTTNHPIELEGLKSKYFRELFHAFVFGDDQFKGDHRFLHEIGDKIMVKLRGSPLAAKTVGRLLRKKLNLSHWIRVLESKEWERQNGSNDIMPALKLSYDHLPFHQQQCFSYSALFPEDHRYSATELINLWIGLDILQSVGRNLTLQVIGLSNLNDLVTHGFFREEKADGRVYYVMHDLLHDLALQVISHECLTVHHSNVGSVEIQPSIRHFSIIIDDGDIVSRENFKSELRKLMTRLRIKQLRTFMLFGKMDKSFASILSDYFREANALRILRLVGRPSSVVLMLSNFPALVHLCFLYLGTERNMLPRNGRKMQLPHSISKFYHLRILDIESLGYCDLPKDFTNLAKLRCFYTYSHELHSHISNVGKLGLLEELNVFRVNKESEGFEPMQLEHLAELRELGIYNLENIHTKEEADKANMRGKNYLERLTLDWDTERSNIQPGVEAMVIESLQPHRYLQKLCIRGHGGPSCPTWLGVELAVEALESLDLCGVSWERLPPLGKMWGLGTIVLTRIATVKEFVIEQSFCRLIRLELVGLESFGKWVPSQNVDHMFPLLQFLLIRDCPKLLQLPFSNHLVDPKPDQEWNIDWFPNLQWVMIERCPELMLVARIPWTETLHIVSIRDVKLLKEVSYNSKSSYLHITGKDDLQSLDEVVAFNNLTGLEELTLEKCPPLQSKHLLLLTSLKKLVVHGSNGVVGPLGGEGDIGWQHPIEHLVVHESSGKELTELLTHFPRLSALEIALCKNIAQLAVGSDVQHGTSAAAAAEVELQEEDGLLLLPAHLCDSLQDLLIRRCPEVVLVDSSSSSLARTGGGGGLQALRSLQKLQIWSCSKILSAKSSPSCCLFPSSLQELSLENVEGMRTLEPLSNLTSLTKLGLRNCGEDLRCDGLVPFLTTGGQLRELDIGGSPTFFSGWDHNNPRHDKGGEEQELQQLISTQSSSKLQVLNTDEAMGLLAAPICSFLSSSITHLRLYDNDKMECFTKEQEDALHLLVSLERLDFFHFNKLQSLPAGLHKLGNLKILWLYSCLAVRSLPEDGLPKSLQELHVYGYGNWELKRQCRLLVGTISKIMLD